jgi:hypothetical protein
MATYKVIQDVEAEDKLIGPLTLRQFIYAGIAAVFLYLSYFFVTHIAAFMLVLFLPISLFSGFFAFPWGRDQPTEVWALAKIRFFLKPRRRIWDQSGVKELVTVTAPKHIAEHFSNNLSQEEVRSRLRALATTIDTRGWAVKNAGINAGQMGAPSDSDRLVGPSLLPQPMDDSPADIPAAEDMLDEQNNASARRLGDMISQSSKTHHDKLVENLKNNTDSSPAPAAGQGQQANPNSYWFLNQPASPAKIPDNAVTFDTQVVAPGASLAPTPAAAPVGTMPDETSIVAELEEHKKQADEVYHGHMRTIQPLSQQGQTQPAQPPTSPPTPPQPQSTSIPAQPAQPAATPTQQSGAAPGQQNANAPVTPGNRAAILQLANNNDLDVATIAREAERATPKDEVVIKLH